MTFTELAINGVYLIDIKKITDERGFFGRAFCSEEFTEKGLNNTIVQVNVSSNPQKYTLRGLHMQIAPYGETKLVRCTRGSIFDVAVDMREGSATYLQWVGVTLKSEDFQLFYVPEGFAHGYLTLEDNTDVMYQVSQDYQPSAEKGYRWNDPAFVIEWPHQPVLISAKDQGQALI